MKRRVLQPATAALACLWVACSAEPPPPPDPARVVRVIEVGDASSDDVASYPGRAEAADEVNLGFEVSGRILERPANVGDAVEAGQVLAQLDLRDFRAAVVRARATRDRTATRLVRVREAAAIDAVSQQDLTDAEAEAQRAAAALAIERKALEDATLRAPFAGRVSATFAEVFQEVRERESVLRLLDTAHIEMWIHVPEDRIDLVPRVESLGVRFDALPGRVFEARIIEIGTEADDQSRTYPVNLAIERQDGVEILPGMAGEATPRLRAGTGFASILVPLSAVFSDSSLGSYVWVVDASGEKVTRRAVETGRLSAAGIAVRKGVSVGERIVVGGARFLTEGSPVKILGEGVGT